MSVCLEPKNSLSRLNDIYSFIVKLLIGLIKVYNYLGGGFPNPPSQSDRVIALEINYHLPSQSFTLYTFPQVPLESVRNVTESKKIKYIDAGFGSRA